VIKITTVFYLHLWMHGVILSCLLHAIMAWSVYPTEFTDKCVSATLNILLFCKFSGHESHFVICLVTLLCFVYCITSISCMSVNGGIWLLRNV
jgi:hypothetical protein